MFGLASTLDRDAAQLHGGDFDMALKPRSDSNNTSVPSNRPLTTSQEYAPLREAYAPMPGAPGRDDHAFNPAASPAAALATVITIDASGNPVATPANSSDAGSSGSSSGNGACDTSDD